MVTSSTANSAGRAELLEKRAAYQDFMRSALRSPVLQRLAANNHSYRHVLRFALHLAMLSGFALAENAAFHAHVVLGIAAYPLYLFLQGLVIAGLMIHSHELSHGHIRHRGLNDSIGIASGLLSLVNFYSFRYAHRFHHKNIGNLDTPEAGAPVSPTGQKKLRHGDQPRKLMTAVAERSASLAMLVAWPIFVVYGDYSSWLLPYRVRKRVDRKSLAVFAVFVLLNGLAFGVAPLAYVSLFLVPAALGGSRILALTYLHHAHEDSVFFGAKHHSWFNAIMFTTDRDYGAFINFFLLNNGYHLPHHVNPSIAYYDLKRASQHLRATIPTGLHYNFLPGSRLFRDFARGQYDARPTEDHDVFQITLESPVPARMFARKSEERFAHA